MWPFVTDGVGWSFSQSVMIVSRAKMAKPIEMLFGLWIHGPREPNIRWGTRSPMQRGQFWGGRVANCKVWAFCRELCKNGWTDRDTIWGMDSGGPKEACVRWGCTLAQPGNRACLDHLTKWSMIMTSSTADRDQWSRSKAPPRSSYLSRPLCWQCDTSVDGRSVSVGRSPGLAEDSRKGVFLLAITGSLQSL